MNAPTLPSAEADRLVTDAGALIFRDPRYAEHDWQSLAVVYNFTDGRQNQYGYVFLTDGSWSAALPKDRDDAILDMMLALQATMAETGKKWHRALVQITRDGQLNVQFEYDDPDRWTIRPNDLEVSVAALRPQ
jgi:hypothetical protein